MPNASDYVDTPIKFLFKGPNQSGKSVAAGSVVDPEKKKKTLYLDIDERFRSIAHYFSKRFPEVLDSIVFEQYKQSEFEKLRLRIEGLAESDKYYCVVVDSLISLASILTKYMINLAGKPGEKEGGVIRRGVITTPGLPEFLGESQGLDDTMAILKSLRCHAILIAHVTTVEITDISGKVIGQKQILLTGGKKIAARIPTFFDEVYHFESEANIDPSKDPDYIFYTKPIGGNFAGTTFGLPSKIKFTNGNFWTGFRKKAEENGYII